MAVMAKCPASRSGRRRHTPRIAAPAHHRDRQPTGRDPRSQAHRLHCEGERRPRRRSLDGSGGEIYGDAEQRLRFAFQVARTLREQDTPAVVQAWMTGVNPELGDRVPLRLMREGDPHIVGPEVLRAARAFLAGGLAAADAAIDLLRVLFQNHGATPPEPLFPLGYTDATATAAACGRPSFATLSPGTLYP